MSNGTSLDTQTTSALELLTVLDSVPVGTNITYSYAGEDFYESSTATKKLVLMVLILLQNLHLYLVQVEVNNND